MSGQQEQTPFSRGVILHWYDGAVSGVGELGSPPRVYAFHMVAWDEHQRERVYVARPLPPDSLDRLVEAFAGTGQPQGPWWAPVRFPSEDARSAAERESDLLLNAAGGVEYVIVSEDPTITARLVVQVGDELRSRIQPLLRSTPNEEDGLDCSGVPFRDWLP